MEDLVLKKPGQRNKVRDAQKNFDRIMEEIKPFIKNKKRTMPQPPKWETVLGN